MKCGSLFTGIEGLDMAVCAHFGAEVAWVSEVEKPLLDRFTVPNVGDVTKVDWSEVEPVDILCGGYPCQPFSAAGERRGFNDPRDLWPAFARAIRILRPCYVVAENVAGHLRFGFERTLRDLAEMGFDAKWGVVRASDAGAPHRRERIFVLATDPASSEPIQRRLPSDGRQREAQQTWVGGGDPPANSLSQSIRDGSRDMGGTKGPSQSPEEERQWVRAHHIDGDSGTPTDTALIGLNGSRSPRNGRAGSKDFDWGTYGGAIRRWERVMGPVPAPVDNRQRLAPEFVEWMMGFPAGYVAGLTRAQALKALGNAVVPQQAALALRMLEVA